MVSTPTGIRPGGTGGDGERREAFKRDPGSGKMVINEEDEDGEGRKGGKKRRRGRDEDGYDSDDSDFDDLKVRQAVGGWLIWYGTDSAYGARFWCSCGRHVGPVAAPPAKRIVY